MARTPRQIINEARGRMGSDELSYEAFSLGAATAKDGMKAYNKVIEDFKYNSVDLQYNEIHTTVDVLADTNVVRISELSDVVDVDMIKYLKYTDTTNNRLVEIMQITAERGKELEALDVSSSTPRFYYVQQGSVYVVPTSDANYSLTIGYQKEVDLVTASTVDTAVSYSQKWESAAVDGVEAYLKRRFRHSDAEKFLKDYKLKLINTSRLLNKHNLKKKGVRRFTYGSRKRSRRIF